MGGHNTDNDAPKKNSMTASTRALVLLFCTLSTLTAAADNSRLDDYSPPVPDTGEFFNILWDDVKTFTRDINPRENYLALSGIAAATALLVKYDQQITDHTQRFARNTGLLALGQHGRETVTIIDFSIGGLDLPFRLPTNTISGFYFLGDAFTHVSLVSGFAIYGKATNSNYALNTSSQVLEGALLTGIVIQVLKRSFGRESPFERSQPGGRWDLFPNQIKYALHVSKYDAMPAGHIATAVTTTYILAHRYPDHHYIKPVGYLALSLIGFGMITNGVHWAGDYPLGFAVGYLAAKVVNKRADQRRTKYVSPEKHSSLLLPYFPERSAIGMRYITFF